MWLHSVHFFLTSDPNVKFRRFSWMCVFVFAVEILVILKFGWNILAIPLPSSAIVSWSGILLIFSVWVARKFCTSWLLKQFLPLKCVWLSNLFLPLQGYNNYYNFLHEYAGLVLALLEIHLLGHTHYSSTNNSNSFLEFILFGWCIAVWATWTFI